MNCENCGAPTKELISPYWLDSLVAKSKMCKDCVYDFSFGGNGMKKSTKTPEEIKQVRIQIMAKAREARMKKIAERKALQQSQTKETAIVTP